jgi:predicted nucleotide-binding protein (sugar kinase/HSP70/actin superfamily)
MQMTTFNLDFYEIQSLMLFLRDFDWNLLKNSNQVVAKFTYDTSKTLYENLKKRGLRMLSYKKTNKPVKIGLTDLEMLSISILAKYPHESAHINMVINKLLLELPIEVINILNPPAHEKSID